MKPDGKGIALRDEPLKQTGLLLYMEDSLLVGFCERMMKCFGRRALQLNYEYDGSALRFAVGESTFVFLAAREGTRAIEEEFQC